jgi:hypothetical protein
VTNAAHSLETVYFPDIYEATFRFMAGSEPEAFHRSEAEKRKEEASVIGVVIVPVGVYLCQEQTVSTII